MQSRGALSLFFVDLGRSMRAFFGNGLFLLLSTLLGVAGYLFQLVPTSAQMAVSWASLPVMIFYIGYVGTERIWFARLFQGETLDRSGIWTWSWHFFPRFFRLSMIFVLLMSPLIVVAVVQALDVAREVVAEMERSGRPVPAEIDPEQFAERMYTSGFLAFNVAAALMTDFLLTFTTPALVFTHEKAWAAMRENFRTMKAGFPGSLLYVLIPSFAALLTLRVVPVSAVGASAYALLAILGTLLNLLFKGATVAFYLRQHPSDDGQGLTAPERVTPAHRSETLPRSELSGRHLR